MGGVSRVGIDTAGGVINGVLAPTVMVNGSNIVVKGATIIGHGSGSHAAPIMQGASSTVFADGIAVCRSGDSATCGHKATGSGDVNAN